MLFAEPITIEKDDEVIDIFLMDTEGITGLPNHQNSSIFTLALLLSSFFIFNSVGVIDDLSLQQLSGLMKVKETEGSRSGTGSAGSTDDLKKDFLWLLRDFRVKLEDENGLPLTP